MKRTKLTEVKSKRRSRTVDNSKVAATPGVGDAPNSSIDDSAMLEYAGVPGASKECQDAVIRLIQFGDRITRARILTYQREHCLLLTVNVGDLVAVKSGFASGYGGEGPRRFSYVLQILDSHGAEIEEYDVSEELLQRVERSALTRADLTMLDESRPRRPNRWHDYVSEDHEDKARQGTLWRDEFPSLVPFAIIDSRIMDLALSFWDDPDNRLLTGYRRLEDLVRDRTGLTQHGSKLFSQAFAPIGPLGWKDADQGEQAGRMQLFVGTYLAHRNPRAHRELSLDRDRPLTEFLLLNHLFHLEADAVQASHNVRDDNSKESEGNLVQATH